MTTNDGHLDLVPATLGDHAVRNPSATKTQCHAEQNPLASKFTEEPTRWKGISGMWKFWMRMPSVDHARQHPLDTQGTQYPDRAGQSRLGIRTTGEPIQWRGVSGGWKSSTPTQTVDRAMRHPLDMQGIQFPNHEGQSQLGIKTTGEPIRWRGVSGGWKSSTPTQTVAHAMQRPLGTQGPWHP